MEKWKTDELTYQETPFEEDEEIGFDDPSGNMPCDNSGFCAGASCPIFFECQGGNYPKK